MLSVYPPGENVSTAQVSEALSSFPGVEQANVYGVQIPGKDGRACMVALVLSGDGALKRVLQGFSAHARAHLPSYAVPLFLRILPKQPLTGTFKLKKVALRTEGIDPTLVTDAMYWLVDAAGEYVPFGPAEYTMITTGRAKL